MSCDLARERLSAAMDGALDAGDARRLDDHVAGCQACAAYRSELELLRRSVRFEPLGDVPDVAPAVVAIAAARGRRRRVADLVAVAAAFVAAIVAGGVFIGLDVREPVQVHAQVSDRVVAAQRHVRSLAADVTVVERGWHPLVPVRRYEGRLAYRAPESLSLRLRDRTDYPDGRWVRNDVDVVADGPAWWARGPSPCPVEALPGCADPEPRVQSITGREPFRAATPVPLDLVVPVRSFALGATLARPGTAVVAGREAVGVTTTAAQVQPLLDGLRQAGTLREVHPADPVEVWLDQDALVPLAVSVHVRDGAERARWAAIRGHADIAGERILEIRLSGVTINEPVEDAAFPPPPRGAGPRDAGFADRAPGTVGVPAPAWLSEGMTLHRAGVARGSVNAPEVAVAAYSDGRAWVKVRATRDWHGHRLFGQLGEAVRRVDLAVGVAYVGDGGRAVAVHGRELDVVVTGTLSERDLLRVAGSIGVRGLPVPAGWAEADTRPIAEAVRTIGGGLRPPALEGFATPAARVVGDALVITAAGPGARGFVLTQTSDDSLTPPLGADVRGVEVRGTAGRYTPGAGELEWVEGGRAVSLRSTSLSLDELVALAERLETHR
jgi:hypothetical protein